VTIGAIDTCKGASFLPRGDCWLWDWRLILLHAPTSLFTFLGFSLIVLISLYIYREGKLRDLALAYPKLWRMGMIFLTSSGLSHLGNFLETWWGGNLYWLTGINKLAMCISTLYFAVYFWRQREGIVWIAWVVERVKEGEGRVNKEEEERRRTGERPQAGARGPQTGE
jgi:hypothetical protein